MMMYNSQFSYYTCFSLLFYLQGLRVDSLAPAQYVILVLVEQVDEVKNSGAVDQGNTSSGQQET